MKNTLASIIATTVLVGLAGCGGGTRTITQTIQIDASDAAKSMELVQATEQVLKRRLAAAQVNDAVVTVTPIDEASATLLMSLPDSAAEDTARRILAEPFGFELMLEKTGIKSASGAVQESEWEPTGLTGENIVWASAIGNSNTKAISIKLMLDTEGQTLLRDVFSKNIGKNVGIFVRGVLISKLSITSGDVEDNLTISGVPSAMVAGIVVDDLNVGIHVTFSDSEPSTLQ